MKLKFLIIYFAASFSSFAQLYFPPVDGSSWETVSPSGLGWQAQNLQLLQDYLNEKKTKAFIILKDGKIAVEWYFGTFTKDSIWYWASAGKTITAFLIGKTQEQGYLKISDLTSKYLGKGWTSEPQEKEDLITIRHQLTMTTGLDDGVPDDDCTLSGCLVYKADAGTRWAYHNAPYTLLRSVIESATGMDENIYTHANLGSEIGMTGAWVKTGYNNVYYSNARSMARFGLLVLNNFTWNKEVLLSDQQYIADMTSSSQQMNKSYGYLWWLNGKGSYMLPQTQLVFNTDMIPNAPDDLIAALGKNDQKVFVVKSLGLVVIRMGESANAPKLAVSSFDNELWDKITKIIGNTTQVEAKGDWLANFGLEQNYPNPFNPSTVISYRIPVAGHVSLKVFDILGREVATLVNEEKQPGSYKVKFDGIGLASGVYLYCLSAGNFIQARKLVLTK